MKYIASCSFGKDSLAMILVLIEKSYPLDEVVFYDTGKEFQAIYDTMDIVLPLLKSLGIKYTELKPEMSFDYKMFEKPVKNGVLMWFINTVILGVVERAVGGQRINYKLLNDMQKGVSNMLELHTMNQKGLKRNAKVISDFHLMNGRWGLLSYALT